MKINKMADWHNLCVRFALLVICCASPIYLNFNISPPTMNAASKSKEYIDLYYSAILYKDIIYLKDIERNTKHKEILKLFLILHNILI